MSDTDVVIEVETPASPVVVAETPAAPAAPATGKPVATGHGEPAAAVSDPVADLKQQLETLRTADADSKSRIAKAETEAANARAEAAQHSKEAQEARAAQASSDLTAIDSAIAAAQAEADAAARDQEAALASGKFSDAATFGRKAARAEARIERLEEGKGDLQARKTAQPKPSAPASPFESAIAGNTPRAQNWFRAHPQYVTDPELNAQAALAHTRAIKASLALDSDAYYEFCETELGLRAAPDTEPAAPAKRQPAARTAARANAMPSAPVSRDASPAGGSLSPTQVTLTSGEQRAATDGSVVWERTDEKTGAVKGQPVGIKEYARRKMLMKQQGYYDRGAEQ